jgi:hypothetical protein
MTFTSPLAKYHTHKSRQIPRARQFFGIAQVTNYKTYGARLRRSVVDTDGVERAFQVREVGGTSHAWGNSPVSAQRSNSSRVSVLDSPRRIASAPSRIAFSVDGDSFASAASAGLERMRGLIV